MSVLSDVDLSHLSPEKRARLEAMFDVDEWPDPLDDGLDHAIGEARPIDGPIEIALEDAPEGVW